MSDERPDESPGEDDETRLSGPRGGDLPGEGETRQLGRDSAPSAHPGGFDHGQFPPGSIVYDRYRIVSFLGRGGMAEVYRADDLTLGQTVALKFLPSGVAADSELVRRLRNEVRIGREIAHPNVCRIYDIVESSGQTFFAMEYVEGEDLASLLRRIGRIPQERALEIARQLCAGLAAAHDRGVLHRDLKPSNVMIDKEGRAKLTDLGLAVIAERVDATAAREGTPAYMSPEQLRGDEATAASDVYALGLVLYELFCGKKPFAARNVGELMELQRSAKPASLSSQFGDVDPAIEKTVLRCLELDPLLRPQSPLAVSMSLPGGDPLAAALAAGETPSPELVAASGSSRSTKPAIAFLSVVATVGLALVATGMFQHYSVERRLPLSKHPQALLDRASEAMTTLIEGEIPAGEVAHGYNFDRGYERWISEHDSSLERWDRIAQARPAYAWYWMRAIPGRFDRPPGNLLRGRTGLASPELVEPGEVYVSLDLSGRLRRFIRMPGVAAKRPVDESSIDFRLPDRDVAAAFELAGLDRDAFTETEPRFAWRGRTDERRAWTGSLPEMPEVSLRVEIGSIDGSLSYFGYFLPWDMASLERLSAFESATTAPEEEGAWQRIVRHLDVAVFAIALSCLVIAAFMTRRNLKTGRGDVSGATRAGFAAFLLMVVAAFFSSDQLAPSDRSTILRVLSYGLFMGMGTWSGYLAIEPILRRHWPTMLVAWTRLISGRWRDPLVGRSVLVGGVAGAFLALIDRLPLIWHYERGVLARAPATPELQQSVLTHSPLMTLSLWVLIPLIFGFTLLLILTWLRRLVGNKTAAAVLFVPFAFLLSERGQGETLADALFLLGAAAIVVALYIRCGLLAAVVAQAVELMVIRSAFTTDLTEWYGWSSAIALAAVLAIALWGAIAATSRGPALPPGTPHS